MNLKKNEIEIIKLLIASTNYISSYDIATATGINRRLVRDEMLNVKENMFFQHYHKKDRVIF